MKPINSSSEKRFHNSAAVAVTFVFLLSIVSLPAAQKGADTQETEAQRIYRQAYEAAIANSPGSTWPFSRLWWGEPSCRHSASRSAGSRGQRKSE